jgi:hypothetical protein
MENCKEIFTRANIVARDSKIRLVDSDLETGLDLFCYTSCDNSEDDFIKQCRGLVFNGETLVLKAFPYTSEYNHEDKKYKDLITNFSDWNFYPSYEGALLRLFYFKNRWFLSTHKKLNAFKSKWGSTRSFGELFTLSLEKHLKNNPDFENHLGEGSDILSRFTEKLDKNKQYMFLVRNFSYNRIVCRAPLENETNIFHVGTFQNEKLDMENRDTGLPFPEKISISNFEDIDNWIKNCDPACYQGLICLGPNNVQIKILQTNYVDMFNLRGNEPSLKFRYLQVRNNETLKQSFLFLYPEMYNEFADYEKTINNIGVVILRSYIQRFIKKYFTTVPVEEYQVVKECHSWHLLDPLNNKIHLNKVMEILNKQPATNLNRMIRRFKNEQQ